MAGIGHNLGPELEGGKGWRRFAWAKARANLLPTLPIEVVRLRVKRAAELGLPYKTYASVRAASGHDVVAFLFSTNALRMLAPAPVLPEERAAKLESLRGVARVALANGRLSPDDVMAAGAGRLDAAHDAPRALASFAETRGIMRAALAGRQADRAVLVGDMALEREWCAVAGLAWYLPAESYFSA